MCGIIGVFNGTVSEVKSGLKKIKNRGKDNTGIVSEGKNHLGHNLHSVVNSVAQPLLGKGKFVANCEIYNWADLNSKYKLNAKNDSDLLFKLIEKKGIEKISKILDEIDGVYAFAYWSVDEVVVCRDIMGEKPVWFTDENGLRFASEKKALKGERIEELNPRKILHYDVNSKKITFEEREFFKTDNLKESKAAIKKKTLKLIESAVRKRLPERKFGILFSGGIDSTTIAYICKKYGVEFTCYTAALEEKGMGKAKDLEQAEEVAKELGFKLKKKVISLSEVKKKLKKIVPLIEDSNVVKVGVALTFYVACEMAKKDGVKVIFSGLGSEEIFAGYDRHKKSTDINKECVSGLLKMYERDLYRDDVITMNNSIELRTPFLDTSLVEYALKIPAKYKIKDDMGKMVLREIASEIGVPSKFALLKKRAAQYGSKFDRAIAKLAKKEGKSKSEYLLQYYPEKNVRLGVLFSSGKDSMYAMHTMQKQNYPIECLISLKSANEYSYMFHTPNIDLVDLQAESLGIPLIKGETEGVKEKELADLKKVISEAKKKYKIQGIVTGAIFSNYQRDRVEKICDSLGLKIFSPLWHIDQEIEMRQIIDNGYSIVMSSIAAEGLDKKWLGREIKHKDIDKLVHLRESIGLNVAGEGGEFESLVLDGPGFSKRIEISKSDIVEESPECARFIVKKAKLVDK